MALDPRREIVVTASGVQALNVTIRCVLDPGDEAIVLTPAWPNGRISRRYVERQKPSRLRILCAAIAMKLIGMRLKPR